MNKLIRLLLKEEIDIEYSTEKFDYSFNLNCSKEDFYVEFKKFLGLYNSFFYHDNRLVFIYNNYEINLQLNDIKQLLELYCYALKNVMKSEKMILAEFIYTYYKTINTKEYKENNSNYNDTSKTFWNALEEKNLRKSFFEDFLKESYNFYKKIVEYAFKNDIFISGELINKIFNNLSPKQEWCEELIENFIKNKKYLCNIIDFDKKSKEHIDTYLEYIYQSLEDFGGYNYAKEIIAKLDRYGSLSIITNKEIVNRYVEVVNKLGNKLQDKEYSFHNGLDEIDNLKNELNYLLKEVKSLNEIQKDKIHECLNQLLGLKRYLLSDNNYVESEMIKMDYSQKVDSDDVDRLRRAIFDNNFLLYSISKMDFIKQMEIALDFYSQYILSSIARSMKIDSKRQIYTINIEKQARSCNDNIKKYFDDIGREYTSRNKDKLLNKLDKNYYEELLKNLSNFFVMHQALVANLLNKAELRKVFKNLNMSVGEDIENEYAMLVSNILAIETDVLILLQKNKLKEYDNGFENINELFEFYKNDKNSVNGLMYINYILYEKSGLNLRNNTMHGNLINTDLTIPLIVTFSALIFISFLLNENK